MFRVEPVFVFVLAIIAMGYAYKLLALRVQEKSKARRDQPPESSTVSAEIMGQLEKLEERVRVLERIVTDDPNELRRQFRDLER